MLSFVLAVVGTATASRRNLGLAWLVVIAVVERYWNIWKTELSLAEAESYYGIATFTVTSLSSASARLFCQFLVRL
jgi:hypothetical protein